MPPKKKMTAGPPPESAPDDPPEAPKPEIDLDEMREESRKKLFAMQMQQPFPVAQVKFKPQAVKGNRALAAAYIDARLVMDRLDEVVGVGCWGDSYQVLQDGSVVCTLEVYCPVRHGYAKSSKQDVGSLSEQPDGGDRLKAAFSDALKRAAVKFGIGRYLYRLPPTWCDYDPVKKQFTAKPNLPDWAKPKDLGPVYAYHEGEEAEAVAPGVASVNGAYPASDATPPKAQEGPKEAKTTLPATSPQAKSDTKPDAKQEAKESNTPAEQKSPTIDDRIKDWAGKLASCDTPSDLNAMKVGLKGEKPDHQDELWRYVLRTANEVGWVWDRDKKEFFAPSEAIPF